MEEVQELVRNEARLPRWMVAWAVLGFLLAIVTGHSLVAAAFALGAGIAILNFFWLRQAIGNIFSATNPRLNKRLVIKYVVRYPLAFGILYLFYRTHWLPFQAVLAGLFVPVVGVFSEVAFQLGKGFRRARVKV